MASVAKREWTYKGETKTAWVVRWKVGKTHPSKQFDRKHDADAYKRRVEREVEDGTHLLPAQVLTIEKVCLQYLSALEIRVQNGTMLTESLAKIKNTVTTRIIKEVGSKTFKSITVPDVENFALAMKKRGLTTAVCRETMALFRRIEEFSRLRRYSMASTVADTIKELRLPPKGKIPTFDLRTINVLFASLEEPDGRESAHHYKVRRGRAMLRVMVYLSAFCGFRLGELRALQLKCLDFEAGTIMVRHGMSLAGELRAPKTRAGLRDFPMSLAVSRLLRDYIDTYMVENEHGLLFTTGQGQPLHATSFHKFLWGPLLTRAGFNRAANGRKAYNFHSLRHFCASWMVTQGVPLTDVAALLGHSRVDTTMQTYAHSINGQVRKRELVEQSSTALLAISRSPVAQELRTEF